MHRNGPPLERGKLVSIKGCYWRLEKKMCRAQTADMTNKEIGQDLLRRIPDDASLQDIARELEFIAAVRQGLAELDNGDSVSIEEVERELPSWIIR
jgi:hypothetical protein